MSVTETLLERNAARRSSLTSTKLKLDPDLHALVLTCADHRVDPTHVLGLELGEAVILRNPGGRVTPAFLESLALLAVIAMDEGLPAGFELIVLHHTDCGLARLGKGAHAGLLARYFRVPEAEVPGKHATDPWASVRVDLETLRSHPMIPPTLVVSGLVYDLGTGLCEVVCPAAPIGGAAAVPASKAG